MNLQRVRYFVAVAQTLSFSKAAQECFVTQVTVTQQIKQLEAEMGARLFDRTRRGVSLTSAGRAFYPEARKILDMVSIAEDRVHRAAQEESRTLRLLLPTGLDCAYVVDDLLRFRDQHPGVLIRCDYAPAPDIASRIDSGDADAAYLYLLGFPLPRGVACEAVDSLAQYVVVGSRSRLAQYPSVRREQLAGERFVSAAESREAFDLLGSGGGAGVEGPGEFDFVGSIDAALIAIALGQGYTILAGPSHRSAIRDMGLVEVPLEGEPVEMGVLYSRGGENPDAREFARAVREGRAQGGPDDKPWPLPGAPSAQAVAEP